MWFEVTNWIVDDSDSKPADFDRLFWSDFKSNDDFEPMIAISIYFDLEIEKVNFFIEKVN